MGDGKGQAGAGGIVKRRIGQIEPGPMGGERLREPLRIGPARREGHAHQLHPVRAQQGLEVEIAGIVHQHRVAGLQQEAAHQFQRLGAGGGEQHLVGAGLDALPRAVAHQHLAQGQRAAAAAIVRQQRVRRLGKAPQGPPDGVLRHPVGGQPAAAGAHRVRSRIEGLPGDPERIHRPVRARRHLRQGEGRHRPPPHRSRNRDGRAPRPRPPAGHRPPPPWRATRPVPARGRGWRAVSPRSPACGQSCADGWRPWPGPVWLSCSPAAPIKCVPHRIHTV